MSSKLWEYFLRDDVESFRRVLANAGYTSGGQRAPGSGGGGGTPSFKVGSPVAMIASSPGPYGKNKKLSGTSPGTPGADRGGGPRPGTTLSRADLNARDLQGRTLLHLVASSPKPTAVDFASALLEIPLVDIYAQDGESGWTALHRALYAGNATIAQALLVRDLRDATDFSKVGSTGHPNGGLIKIKDREGYSPFDVYGATIMSRDIKQFVSPATALDPTIAADLQGSDAASNAPSHDDREDSDDIYAGRSALKPRVNLGADEIFTLGSNKNLNLGLGDQDDRQFPERVALERPEHLLQRFFREYQEERSDDGHNVSDSSTDLPVLIKNKPVKFQNMVMSKLHTAILTDDPESNLFMCGFGPGGRLGTGDESTRFSFACIETGGLAKKKVISIALGQDHSLAITEQGEIFSWGSNKFGQLGYNLPRAQNRDDVPIQTTPRQIFNPFKKEIIYGAAASAIHSVVFSSSGLYTFGKNEGQLGLVDSDARSLEAQTTPRRVGASLFSAGIQMVTAIDHATAVLLQNHEVWVFSQYGYSKITFPLDISSRFIRDSFMATRYDTSVNHIVKITSGGSAICALSSSGDVFTVQVNKSENPPALTSTTNPSKIKNSLSSPTREWSVKRSHMAVRDVDVGQDGSIIICTNSGSAWRKEKRHKSKGALKDYKFVRIPGLSRVVGVRSNAFGAYAVAQRDCNVTREQIEIDQSTLWNDLLPLSPFDSLMTTVDTAQTTENDSLESGFGPVMSIKRTVLSIPDIESRFLSGRLDAPNGTVWLSSSQSEARISVHEIMLTGRSPILRKAFHQFRQKYYFSIPDVLDLEYGHDGRSQIRFHDVDFLAVLNLAFFLYTDNTLDVWQLTRISPEHTTKYRQVRTEVMRIGTHLELPTLERAARLMIEPTKALKTDMARAINDPSFFENADVVVELNGGTRKVHSQVVCQRCPFFEALFHGRSGGKWLSLRRTDPNDAVHVDLKHIDRSVFDFVLRHIYADTEEQLFDEVRSESLEDFIDLVFDVAFTANELMIDRLAQVCQKMLGRFVHNRNVCYLLNIIAPCYVKEFKDAALEYICLNLEDLLSNGLLKGLDEELLSELDSICHDNQMACFPISRGRNSDDYIFEKYPELVALVERDKQRMIDSMELQTRMGRVETRQTGHDKPGPPSASKAKGGPLREIANVARSPVLKSKQSTNDLMFEMDEEAVLSPGDSMKGKTPIRGFKQVDVTESPLLGSSLVEDESFGDRSFLDGQMASPQDTLLAESPSETRAGALQRKKNGVSLTPNMGTPAPWGSPMATGKKDLKDIMAETSDTRVSNLSLGMSKEARRESSNAAPKLSQKERKKLQQQQMQERLAAEQKAKEASQNPWKLPSAPANKPDPPPGMNGQGPQPMKTPQRPAMTLRQTVAGTPPPSKLAAPVQTQSRSVSANVPTPSPLKSSAASGPSTTPVPFAPSPSNNTQPQPPAIQSVRHIPRPEPYQTSFHTPSANSLSLAAILMQQQTEKDEIHEAATAKHNLQEIQAEQEFQEWWDKESRRVQGLPDPEQPESSSAVQEGKDTRGGRGKGSSRNNNSNNNNKRRGGGGGRGKDGGAGGSGPRPASDASALTQQLNRHRSDNNNRGKQQQPQQQQNSHTPASQPRGHGGNRGGGGGRGGARGRGGGRERARV
ncbi:hypothetical protein SI65_09551 [Aspergillus cristatus]|uniref:BTB domain-containing protein n=1 Tax=Aspergillus cristatus TaxID=573508 RepID=A0A1E3B279_ASPCR|nr:hypothetical protein SI65_09551 [Aspergillus cristatus]